MALKFSTGYTESSPLLEVTQACPLNTCRQHLVPVITQGDAVGARLNGEHIGKVSRGSPRQVQADQVILIGDVFHIGANVPTSLWWHQAGLCVPDIPCIDLVDRFIKVSSVHFVLPIIIQTQVHTVILRQENCVLGTEAERVLWGILQESANFPQF